MQENESILKQIQGYLNDLGYPLQSMVIDRQIESFGRVDLLVYSEGQPWIVVETKRGEQFPDPKDGDRLRFNPYVRKLQSVANSVNAPYYLLTNGESFLWFTTDTSGRPQRLDSPILPIKKPEPHKSSASKDLLLYTFRTLKDFLYRIGKSYRNDEIGAIILAKLLSEKGDDSLLYDLNLQEHKTSYQERTKIWNTTFSIREYVEREYLNEVYPIIRDIVLTDANSVDLLSAIDEVFLNESIKRSDPRTPRWMADFLGRLAIIDEDSIVLDIASGYGDILTSTGLILKDRNAQTWGLVRTPEQAIWSKIQQLIVGNIKGDVLIKNPLYFDGFSDQDFNEFPRPTHIISAPPFGGKVDRSSFYGSPLAHRGLTQLEDLYLEVAIRMLRPGGRLVFLVPEGMLFSTKRHFIRDLIEEASTIRAIISIASGALLPFSGIKTSILVIDKAKSDHSVFMAQIKEMPVKEVYDCRTISEVSNVLSSFQTWLQNGQTPTGVNHWIIPKHKLDTNNLTATHYLSSETNVQDALSSSFSMVRIDELTKLIKRGTGIRLDEQGDISVIGPGAIRPLDLDISGLGRTTEHNLPSRTVVAEVGDVILNNISMYLGAAAVVSLEAAGSYLSQHVILIRPDQSQILPEYLAVALNSDFVKPQIQQMATGTIIPALSVVRLSEILIPLPDMEVQKKIVSRIDGARILVLNAKSQLTLAERLFSEMISRLTF
jgi:SAM-dependent methyltransferase